MEKLLETEKSPTMGTGLVTSILRKAGRPLTTRELSQEVRKVNPYCIASTVIALNVMRITGVINGRRSEMGKGWVWWVD